MRTSSKRKLLHTLSFAAIAVLIVTMITAIVSVAPAPTQAATWTQIWNDEFSGANGSALDGNNWLYDIGHGYTANDNWGTGEIEYMTNSTSNVYQDGAGHLVIKPIRDGSGNWTSGRVETQRTDFAAPAGGELAVEASLQQPNVSGAPAAGYWPAFWMLGQAFRGVYSNWPGIGEIDIMEDINGLSSEFGTLHCGTNPGGPCNETTGIGSGQRQYAGLQTGFHTYRMEYDRSVSPEQIRYYMDGSNFFTINANQVDATTWNNAVHHGFFVILNVAMGGGFPGAFGGGPTGSTQSGVPMLVDYVRVYTSGGATPTATPKPATPTPTQSSGGSGCAVAYNNSSVYTGGMQASYNGHNWTAKWWTQGEAPSTGGSGVWTDNGACGGGANPTATPKPTSTPVGPTATPKPATPTPTAASGFPAWAPNVSYAAGAQVSYAGLNYKCLQAHTSQTGWEPPNVPALWQKL